MKGSRSSACGLLSCLLLSCLLTLTGCERRQPVAAGAPAVRGLVQHEAAPPPAPPPRVAARQTYRNVPVLGELDSAEFDRTMQAITAWVAPQAGCSHCHVDGDAASDAKPAKAQARQMLQMVQHINNNWKPHVGSSGVTCQTCHQGQARPPAGAAATVLAAQPAVAAGRRMLADINGNFLTGSATTKAACSSCHGAGEPRAAARTASARTASARNYPALLLLPTEAATAGASAIAAAGQNRCEQAAGAAARAGTRLGLAMAKRPVVGNGTLALFSAPDADCALLDLHLLPGDTVEAFVAHGGYTSVRYRRAATGSEARGWVRDDRLGPGQDPANLAVAVAAGDAVAARPAIATTAAAIAPAGCSSTDPRAGHEPLRGRARVLGQGRLQFYAAPDASCPLRGVFILPGEPVETLQRAPGFIAVRYVNPRTGGLAQGWVDSQRLGGG